MIDGKYTVLLFGTGKNAERTMQILRSNNVIISGAVDSNPCKQNKLFHETMIYAPVQIINLEFDYVIITSVDFLNIQRQMEEIGIDKARMISVQKFDHEKYGEWQNIFFIEKLNDWEKNLDMQKSQHKMNNMPYEQYDCTINGKLLLPTILGANDAIEELIKHEKSLSRFGEGEFKIISGRDIGFQKTDVILAERLKTILKSNNSKVLIGLPDMYGAFINRTQFFMDFFREYLDNGEREREYELFDFEKTYYDSFLTRPYIDYQDRTGAGERFEQLKRIWYQREVVIVEGNKTFLGVGNDLFQQAASCERIECPNEDAFCFYNEIFESVKKVSKKKLILIALGPTASVLAYDLAMEGYQAIDIGHIDVEYEWFLMRATEKTAIPGKYTNEVWGGNRVKDTLYLPNESVLQRIGE